MGGLTSLKFTRIGKKKKKLYKAKFLCMYSNSKREPDWGIKIFNLKKSTVKWNNTKECVVSFQQKWVTLLSFTNTELQKLKSS